MEFLFFFSLTGVVIVTLILKFDKKQTVKVNTVLKETRSVPPLFMLKSTEQKISVLKTALRFDDVPQNMADAASMSKIYSTQSESNRLSKVQELKLLSSKYNNGQISIEAYNQKLDELLEQVQSQGGSFELAC
ncbi:hypothetical protein [Mucilaginibacter sp.]|uniref:hypothetical protein n=1 Tax=Mucilaginibacter sp. TaxID=1882438 RepID=UPI00284AF43A|nr:hypothetical protein [Mucilaginibacter sp.]MDR3693344.1 hypothetical protein [Mucilaginibacter sp.]